jgi:long-subunit acyl-CoA synthetase (AMP-forming)
VTAGREGLANSAVLPSWLAGRFAAVVGGELFDGYRLTEAGPNVAVSAPGCHRIGTVGLPLGGTTVRIGPGGEIEVRGPGVMTGYHGDPAATPAAFTPDGRLPTDDLGELDSRGHLRLLGRAKDMITVQARPSHRP